MAQLSNPRIFIIRKLFAGLMALLVLNASIEMTNLSPKKWNGIDYVEDLEFNDIESMYELIGECILDFENGVPETDDHDEEKSLKAFKDWIAPTSLVSASRVVTKAFTFFDRDDQIFSMGRMSAYVPPDVLLLT